MALQLNFARYPDTMEAKELTKVHIDLPNHWAVGGESMWARPLGGDEYEIHNVPFHAYNLNYLDVVEAVATMSDLKPSVLRVLRRSGHQTIRVMFADSTPALDRVSLLESLSDLHASFEGATKKHFAIDVEPDGKYDAVCARLDKWNAEGLLDYETCEARVDGSFDDSPKSAAIEDKDR